MLIIDHMKVRKLVKKFLSQGFVYKRHGRHGDIYKHIDGRETEVCAHCKNGDVSKGDLRIILKQIKHVVDNF